MFGTGSQYFVALTVLAVVAAVVYGFASDGGYELELMGTIVFSSLAVGGAMLLGQTLMAGDSASAERQRAADHRPSATAWPAVAALGVGITIVGLVVSTQMTLLGLIVLLVAAIEWTISAWADNRSTDPATNKAIRDRLLQPIETPVFAVAAVAFPVFLFSRVLLAVSRDAASYVAMTFAAVVLAIAFIVYAKPGLLRRAVPALLAIGAVVVIVVGIVSAGIGERDFHQPVDEEHTEEVGE